MRLKVRKNGFELSDSLFLTGSRINTEFSLGAPGENDFELPAKAKNGFDFMEKLGKKPFLVKFRENV
jgi:hypothetical protein